MTSPRADDYEDVEFPIEAVTSSVAAAGGSDQVTEGLIEMIGVVAKLGELLRGVDEDEFRVIGPRLARFKAMVAALPDSVPPRRRVGFRGPVRRTKPAKRIK